MGHGRHVTSSSKEVLTPPLSLWAKSQWRLNDNAANVIVIDTMVFSNGSAQQNTNILHTDGKIDGALTFNGTSDYIDTNNNFQDLFRNSFTVNFWLRKLTPQGSAAREVMGLVNTVSPWNYFAIGLATPSGRLSARYAANCLFANALLANESTPYTFATTPSEWKMLTVIVTQLTPTTVNLKIYVNAILRVTSATKTQTMSNFIYNFNPFVGNANSDGVPIAGEFLEGIYDAVTFFVKALTQPEIELLYNNGDGMENF